MKRLYTSLIKEHFSLHEQILFFAGPRQVGKTTITQFLKDSSSEYYYFNWDIQKDKLSIIEGPTHIGKLCGLDRLKEKPYIIFDEIHKFRQWKIFIKGFYDQFKSKSNIIVTGSAKLTLYQKSGDSLMGRYLLYRVHPISVGEITNPHYKNSIKPPCPINKVEYQQLIEFGGFPDPFLKKSKRFWNQWQTLRHSQLFQEDIRDLTSIQEITGIETMALLLEHYAGQIVHLSTLANKLNIAVSTVSRWLSTLEQFYFCYRIKPWHKNISRSLIKDSKLYLWDWSNIKDRGAKAENFIASHLLKSVQFWSDHGEGQFELFYIRTKDKKEVDFIITKDQTPWCLIEAKENITAPLSPSLAYFQEKTGATYAFQVAVNGEYIDKDCFSITTPTIVPAQTFLSQLI